MLINKTQMTQTVKVITADGKKDSVNLQPRGRLTLAPGTKIDPTAFSSYRKTITGIDTYAPAAPAPAPAAPSAD